MRCGPRNIIGNLRDIPRDINRYCGRVVGSLAGLFRFIVSLINATVDRNSTRTVTGFASDAELADGQVLLNVPVDIPALEGFRLDGTTWHSTDINGLALPTEGLSVADTATNEILHSQDLGNSLWTKRGTFSIVRDLVGADGLANTGWTASGIDVIVAGDIFQTVSGKIPTTRYEPSLVLQQISISGELSILGASIEGNWTVDLSKLSPDWEIIDRNHPSVTVVDEFIVAGSGVTGMQIIKKSGTGTLSVGYFNSQLELGTISSPQIYTTTPAETREADLWSEPTPSVLTPQKGAIEMVIDPSVTGQGSKFSINSFVDTDNNTGILLAATGVFFRKRVLGVNIQISKIYTHLQGVPLRVQIFWDEELGMGVRATDASADIDAISFVTNVDASDAPLAATIDIGHRDGGVIFQGTYKTPIFYASKAAAGWS